MVRKAIERVAIECTYVYVVVVIYAGAYATGERPRDDLH